MQKKIDNNYCLVTGVITEIFKKKADSVDIKRPCIRLKVLYEDKETGQAYLDDVYAVFPGGTIAKITTGCKVGEVVDVQGRICVDENEGLFLEVSTIRRVNEIIDKGEKQEKRVVSEGISQLLKLSQILNVVFLQGSILKHEDKTIINVNRNILSKGDLKNSDNIPIHFNGESDGYINREVLIVGRISYYGELCINVDNINIIQ